jgi:vesicle coat complex subunit
MAYFSGMNDLQIARNLGEMFENATRSLNLQFDTKNMTLPPSVTSFINTNYYNIETTFTIQEIIKGLESNNDNEIYTVLKHLVGKLATHSDFNGFENNYNYTFDVYNDNDNDNDNDNNGTIKEIIQLFPYIIKNINSPNLKIKRLVYILLLRFNHLQQDISLLSINAIQKSLNDKNAINRSLAIRCLSGIKIPAILPILLLSIGKLIKDSSPLVRSACAIAIIKCIKLDIYYNMKLKKDKGNNKNKNKDKNNNKLIKSIIFENNFKLKRQYLINNLNDESSTIYQLSQYLEILLSDNDSKVLSCAIITYYEIFNGCFDLLHNKLNNLIKHFQELDGFAKVNLLDIITEYSKLFFEPFNEISKAPLELQKLYNEINELIFIEMDYNVILSMIKCLINLYEFEIKNKQIKLNKIMIKLIQRDYYNDINEDSKILISLNIILYLINKKLINFKNYQISNFVPLSNDNCNIFNYKILIIFKIINKENFDYIFKELKYLIEKSEFNNYFKFKILQNLNKLILNKNLEIKQFSKLIRFFMNKLQIERNELLIGEYITGLRQLIQSNLGYYNEILIKLTGRLINNNNKEEEELLPKAKSSIIWLLGEFIINYQDFNNNIENNDYENIKILKNFLPDLSLKLIKSFKNEENYHVRLEILIFISKLLISDIINNDNDNDNGKKGSYKLINNQNFKIFNYLLQLSKYDNELDIRDMSRLLGSLLPNIVYYSEIGINEEINVDYMLTNDSVLMEHCINKCGEIDVAVLMFQLNKPQIRNGNDNNNNNSDNNNDNDNDVLMDSIDSYLFSTSDKLDLGYLQYYRDLRNEGFELKDYTKYHSTMMSSVNSMSSRSIINSSHSGGGHNYNNNNNNNNNNTATVSPVQPKKVQLQTLDDFLGG